jgi:hypothetical protein
MVICWQTFGEPPLSNQLDDDQKCWPGLGMLRSGDVKVVRFTAIIGPIGHCMHACLVASGQMLSPSRPLTLHLPTSLEPTQASSLKLLPSQP